MQRPEDVGAGRMEEGRGEHLEVAVGESRRRFNTFAAAVLFHFKQSLPDFIQLRRSQQSDETQATQDSKPTGEEP
jgi:hypothetical protein